jgi:hypothetical protein
MDLQGKCAITIHRKVKERSMSASIDSGKPSPWIVTWSGLVSPEATVLDVAAGRGRHARFFRQRGNPVVAIDREVAGMADLHGDPGLTLLACDLEDGGPWRLGEQRFGAIVVTNYLHRPLFPALIAALGAGGILLYETFMVGHERFGPPKNPDFLLRDGELLDRLRPALQIVAYEARIISDPRPALVQRVAARRP